MTPLWRRAIQSGLGGLRRHHLRASPWQNGVQPNPRTSLVVYLPDGRIPPLTPEAKARLAAGTRPGEGFPYVVDDHHGGATVHADNARDLGQGTSCVTQSGGPPLTPPEYNAGVFIAQNPDDIVIETETGSELRIIPLTPRPDVGANIHQWHGDSRGHWEGDTLVVETTNMRPDHTYRNGQPDTQKITEYFTRTSAATIEYKFTVTIPRLGLGPGRPLFLCPLPRVRCLSTIAARTTTTP